MMRQQLGRQAFKVAVLGLAVLGGMVECAALWRVRLSQPRAGARQP